MSGKRDRGRRDLDLMMKSYRALEAEQNNPSTEPFEREPVGRRSTGRSTETEPTPVADEDSGDVVMYRGRPVRRGSSATPGAGSSQRRPSKSRDGEANDAKRRSTDGGKAGKSAKGVSIDKIKQALATLSEMHEEGLITKAEFDNKRRELLDRL